jgi:Tfp pilus assembly ATPase PilU
MDYDPSNEEHREAMERLIEEGAAILDGIDENGEPIYKFDMNVLEEVMPELHQAMMDDMDKVLIGLYQKGLIEITYDEDLNAQMSVSPEGKRALEEAGFDLDGSEEEEF